MHGTVGSTARPMVPRPDPETKRGKSVRCRVPPDKGETFKEDQVPLGIKWPAVGERRNRVEVTTSVRGSKRLKISQGKQKKRLGRKKIWSIDPKAVTIQAPKTVRSQIGKTLHGTGIKKKDDDASPGQYVAGSRGGGRGPVKNNVVWRKQTVTIEKEKLRETKKKKPPTVPSGKKPALLPR